MDIILILLASYGFAHAWDEEWLPNLQTEGSVWERKPWACKLCMSSHVALLFGLSLLFARSENITEFINGIWTVPALSFAAYGTTYLIERAVQYMDDLRV